MTNPKRVGNIVPLLALVLWCLALAAPPASAQATRTWVSGTGNDANPCSRTAPCKTFAGAISKTATGGEINALDPGGFGALTITKSITIDGGGGQVASVLAAGTNGIIINAAAGSTVTLRNLRINGVGGTPTPGLNGVQFLAGLALHIENCAIFGFSQNGININVNTASAVQVYITDTLVTTSLTGINARNAGAGKVSLSIQRTAISQSGTGLKVDGTGGGAAITASVSDSMIDGNATGVSSLSGPGNGSAIVTRSSIVNNTTGASATGAGGIIFSNTLISGNQTGITASGGGSLLTYKNNAVDGNVTNGAFTTTLIPE
jgi:hypothetical protein